ncbi:MAG TPA: hypothetical protein PKK94_01565 [Leptospiraceae bacterium]|nr:hypothetical protein [Leptospiraceae bacterium]
MQTFSDIADSDYREAKMSRKGTGLMHGCVFFLSRPEIREKKPTVKSIQVRFIWIILSRLSVFLC